MIGGVLDKEKLSACLSSKFGLTLNDEVEEKLPTLNELKAFKLEIIGP